MRESQSQYCDATRLRWSTRPLTSYQPPFGSSENQHPAAAERFCSVQGDEMRRPVLLLPWVFAAVLAASKSNLTPRPLPCLGAKFSARELTLCFAGPLRDPGTCGNPTCEGRILFCSVSYFFLHAYLRINIQIFFLFNIKF